VVDVETHLTWEYPALMVAGSLLAVILLELTDSYQIATLRQPMRHFGTLLLVWSGSFALMALAGFMLKTSEDFSRVWFAGWFLTGLAGFVLVRALVARLVRRWARNGMM